MFPFLLSLTAAFTHHHIDNQHQRHVSLENAVLWDKELGDISVLCEKESGKKQTKEVNIREYYFKENQRCITLQMVKELKKC